MIARQRDWPRQWLMTDERMGNRLWAALERVPSNDGGIVFRHYATDSGERSALARKIAEICRSRALTLAVARDQDLTRALGAELVHNPLEPPSSLPFSCSAHSLEQAEAARAQGASLVFVSPVHCTRSHPGRQPLGEALALRIAAAAGVPAIALGGMDARRFAAMRDGFYGWAAIDAWMAPES